jgi:hypothetical protein
MVETRRRAASVPNIMAEGDVEPRRIRTRDDDLRRSRLFPVGRVVEERLDDLEFAVADITNEAIENASWRKAFREEMSEMRKEMTEAAVDRRRESDATKAWAEGLIGGVRSDMQGVPAAVASELAPSEREKRVKRLKQIGATLAAVAFAGFEAWKMLGGAK